MSLPGGGLAVGGGGVGLVGLAIYLLVALISNGGDLSGPLQYLPQPHGRQPAALLGPWGRSVRPVPRRTRARTAASSAT